MKKIFTYLIVAFLLHNGFELMLQKVYACPRCRRAEPKGPKKLPHPSFPSARPAQNQVSTKR